LNNLIGNAIKFSFPNSKIEVSIKCIDKENSSLIPVEKLNTDPAGDIILISVKDSGIGIADDLKQFVFNPFSEAKRPGTSGENANGLGMSISLQIAKAHGGNIWFESEEGKGTTFYFAFPA